MRGSQCGSSHHVGDVWWVLRQPPLNYACPLWPVTNASHPTHRYQSSMCEHTHSLGQRCCRFLKRLVCCSTRFFRGGASYTLRRLPTLLVLLQVCVFGCFHCRHVILPSSCTGSNGSKCFRQTLVAAKLHNIYCLLHTYLLSIVGRCQGSQASWLCPLASWQGCWV